MRLYKLIEYHDVDINVEVVDPDDIILTRYHMIQTYGYSSSDDEGKIIFNIDFDFIDNNTNPSLKIKLRDISRRIKADIRNKTINNILNETI